MLLDERKVRDILDILRTLYPGWDSFAHPAFVRDEIAYKRASVAKARRLLAEDELKRLLQAGEVDEFIRRLDALGKDNNLLWRQAPATGDLGVLYQPELDRPAFCEAVIDLLYGAGPGPDRLGRYAAFADLHSLQNKWTFPTYFLFMCHPGTEMFVKPSPVAAFLRFIGSPVRYTPAPNPTTYAAILEVVGAVRTAFAAFEPADNVDVQGLIWSVYSALGLPAEAAALPLWKLFQGRELAGWALDLMGEGARRLGASGPDDTRFTLALPVAHDGRLLRLSFGRRPIIEFHRPGQRTSLMVNLALWPEAAEAVPIRLRGRLIREVVNGRALRLYELPVDQLRPLAGELRDAWMATLDHLSEEMAGETAGFWRGAHLRAVFEAALDLKRRRALLGRMFAGDAESGLQPGAGLAEVEGVEANEVEFPAHLLHEPPAVWETQPVYSLAHLTQETGLPLERLARWVAAIERKGQAILYGPPGTGKTYVAERLARHLAGGEDGFWELVQFHPGYAYEDFVQGIRPRARAGGGLDYPLVSGRFLEFCARAARRTGRCVLVIDEINRADLPRVFGELMYLLEYRDRAIPLASGGHLRIPANVRILGTMNTADRSIALFDYALRRRFAFLALYPDPAVLRQYHVRLGTGFDVEGLIRVLERLNQAIHDPHYQVGVTFFLHENLGELIEDVWRTEIEPYLEEYFFDQPEQAAAFRWERVHRDILP